MRSGGRTRSAISGEALIRASPPVVTPYRGTPAVLRAPNVRGAAIECPRRRRHGPSGRDRAAARRDAASRSDTGYGLTTTSPSTPSGSM